jgi:hypothetical protein
VGGKWAGRGGTGDKGDGDDTTATGTANDRHAAAKLTTMSKKSTMTTIPQ